MFAVVDDEQQLLVPHVVLQQLQGIARRLISQVQRAQRDVDDELVVAHVAQFHDPSARSKSAGKIGRCSDGQPRLADAAGTDDADEPRIGQALSKLGKLVMATDEATRLSGQVAPAPNRSRHV
jgi:hypothetical protein